MAKTGYILVPPESEDLFYKDLQTMDRYIIPRIRAKAKVLSTAQKQATADKSYLPTCQELWANLSDETKQLWYDYDPHAQQHGWRSFVADQCNRIKLGLEGVATPNQYHQDLVGKLLIQAPASEIKIGQYHPHTYQLYQKVAGSKDMYEMAEIKEAFSLPLKITISYKSNLVSTGPGTFVRFYASVRHLYQGQNLNHDLIINIPLINDWTSDNITTGTLSGLAQSYNLFIHIYNATGELLIDNIKAEHNGSNWVRDPFCKDINRNFTRQFSSVLANWAPITLPTGATYKSVYPT